MSGWLGRGLTLEGVLAHIGQEAEGVATARTLHLLSHKLGLEMPITEQVVRILFEGLSPMTAVSELLQREPKPE